ncbi:unnamed protein product [Amoebophrya sp. A120]|nr:unnamed protein product [Amoebophrya sp. A120]|eukprot:GSA120T00003431001.1
MRFCGAFRGVLFPEYTDEQSATFDKNSTHLCRVFAKVPQQDVSEEQQPELHLCALPHIVTWESLDFRKTCEELREGSHVDGTVTQVQDFNARLEIKVPAKDGGGGNDKPTLLNAVCHSSKMDKESAEKPADKNKKEKKTAAKEEQDSTKTNTVPSYVEEGMEAKARVLGFNQLDRALVVGMSSELVEEKILCAKDLQLGQLVRGDITKVIPDRGVFVKISSFVTAEIPLQHLTNVPLKQVPESKFKAGQKIKARVLSLNFDTNKVKLTAKKDLVKTDPKDLLTDEHAVKLNQVTSGYVHQVQEIGVIVRFFGDRLHGLVPCKDPEVLHSMKPGALVRVRVVAIRGEGKLKLSFDVESKDGVANQGDGNSAKFFAQPGCKVPAAGMRVFAVDETGCFVVLPNRREAYIPQYHFADDLAEAGARFQKVEVGKSVEECLGSTASAAEDTNDTSSFLSGILLGVRCYRVNMNTSSNDGDLVTSSVKHVDLLSLKQSLQVGKLSEDGTPSSTDAVVPVSFVKELTDIKVQQQKYFLGYVKQICAKKGVFISLGDYKNAVGIAPLAQCTDHFCVEPQDEFKIGQTVRVVVKSIDFEKKLANFDLRHTKLLKQTLSIAQNATVAKLESSFLASTLKLSSTTDQSGRESTSVSGSVLSPKITAGQCVRGKVIAVKDYGLFLEPVLGEKDQASEVKGIKLLAMAHNVDDFEKPPSVGSEVDAFILDVNTERKLVDVSLKTNLLARAAGSSSKTPTAGALAPGEEVECEVHLAKTDRTILVTTNGLPKVVFAPNADAFNRLQTAAVSMQRGMFARKMLVLQQEVVFAGSDGAAPSAWLAHLAASRKEGAEQEDAKDEVENKPAAPSTSSKQQLEVSRISDPAVEATVGTVLQMRVQSVGPTSVVLQCPNSVWGHLHACDLPLGKIADFATKKQVATTQLFKLKDVVSVKVEKVSENKTALGCSKTGIKGTQLLVSLAENGGAVSTQEEENKPAKKRKKMAKAEVVAPETLLSQAAALSWTSLKEEQSKSFRAVVVSVAKDHLQVELAPGIRGRVSVLDIEQDDAKTLFDRFVAGQLLPAVWILHLAKSKRTLNLSLVSPETAKKQWFSMTKRNSTKIPAVITMLNPKCTSGFPIRVSLPLLNWAEVHVTQVGDANIKQGNVLKRLKVHQAVTVQLDAESIARAGSSAEEQNQEEDKETKPLRAAIVDEVEEEKTSKPVLLSDERLKQQIAASTSGAQKIYTGVVRNFHPNAGVFVALTPNFSGRVQFKDLPIGSELNISKDEIQKKYPIGTVLENLVRIVRPNAESLATETENHRLELSLTDQSGSGEAAASSSKTESRQAGQMKQLPVVGSLVSGVVRGKKDFGLFIRLDETGADGLCHVTEIEDRPLLPKKQNTPEKRAARDQRTLAGYSVGQKVQVVKVTKVENGKVSLSMRPSVLAEAETALEEVEDEEKETALNAEVNAEIRAAAEAAESDEEDGSEEEEASDGAESDAGEQACSNAEAAVATSDVDMSDAEEEDSDEEAESDEDDVSDEDDPEQQETAQPLSSEAIAQRLAQKRKQNQAALAEAGTGNSTLTAGKDAAVEEQSDEEQDLSPAAKRRKKLLEDAKKDDKIRERERETLENTPRTPDDFERLLLSDGGKSSFLWIQYLAHHMELSEIQKARAIAERGVKHICFATDQERLNVWVAYLNLEAHFGDKNSLAGIFQRACQYNKAKTVYLKLAEIQEKRGKKLEAKQLYEEAAKKFSQSKKVWIARLKFLYSTESDSTAGALAGAKNRNVISAPYQAEARELLPRALNILERRKHIPVIQKAAAFEFEHGSVERGKTLFESMLAVSAQKKRLDLWNVFLDLCARKLDVEEVRRLYAQKIDELKTVFKARKMKFFFKKWLDYETRYGDEEGQLRVKAKAKEFVDSEN